MERTINLLNKLNDQIQHLKSSSLRADTLLKMLKLELDSLKEINLNKAINDTSSMLNTMNRLESIAPLSYCVYLIEHYLQTNDFDIIAISDNNSTIDNQKYKFLKNHIRNIIILEPDDDLSIN